MKEDGEEPVHKLQDDVPTIVLDEFKTYFVCFNIVQVFVQVYQSKFSWFYLDKFL